MNQQSQGGSTTTSTRTGGSRGSLPTWLALSGLLVFAGLALVAGTATAVPTVTIASPTDLAVIASGTVPIDLSIAGFTLDCNMGGNNVVDTGHYHVMLDGSLAKMDCRTTTFLADVADGAHTLTIELAENDHTLLGINDTITFSITPASPRVRILAPFSSTSWNSSSVELQIWVDNFTYNPGAIGGISVPGEGHYRVFVDGGYFYYGTTDFFNVTYLTPGHDYRIRVALHNNDNSTVSPAVFDEITITVRDGAPTLLLDFNLFQAAVNASSLPVPFTVTNFTIDPAAIGQAAVQGRGHYHAWLDGVFLGPAAENPIDLTDLSVGAHTIVVELRNNDHSSLSPRVVDYTFFTVVANAPRVTITAPAATSTINSTSVELSFSIGNFTMDAAAIGSSTNVPGVGHWHVLVDGAYMGFGTAGRVLVSNLSEGPHIITIELRNNDHSALASPAFDRIGVAVLAGAPRLSILSPNDGAAVNASSVTLSLFVQNFVLDAAAFGGSPEDGHGHWHLYANGALVTMGTSLTIPWDRVEPGTYLVRVELVNNDHTALSSVVADEITVTVPAGRPWISITAPADAGSINSTSIWVNVTVANFTLDGTAIGSPTNVAGVGHYHILVDGNYVTASAGARVAVFDLQPGTHTVRAELRNNDHSALGSPAFDEITITVLATAPWINITTPVSGSTVALNWTAVTVTVTNFVLDPAAIGSPTNVAGRGHYHLFIDGVYKGMAGTTSSFLIDLTPGTHVISVELRNNDHSTLTDPVWDEVSVTVTGLKPSIALTAPTTGAIIWGNSTNVSVTVVNFTLDAGAIGGTSVNGRGHWHVYVDGVYQTATAATTLLLQDLAPGDHWINVSLNSNDHSALGVPQGASVFVHVAKLPSIRISDPASGLSTANNSVTITVVVTDLTLDPSAIGQAPVAGRGHYHVFVDNVYVGASGTTTYTVTNLTAGNHTISVRPFNNDHTEIPGTLSSSITLRVTSASSPPPSGFLPGPGAAEVAVSMALAAVAVALVGRRRRA